MKEKKPLKFRGSIVLWNILPDVMNLHNIAVYIKAVWKYDWVRMPCESKYNKTILTESVNQLILGNDK